MGQAKQLHSIWLLSVRPESGTVTFQPGCDAHGMHQRAQLGMGYLTQEPSVFRKLTVAQNILAILETCRLFHLEHNAPEHSPGRIGSNKIG